MTSWSTITLGYCAYQELGVDEHADAERIRAAYRRLAARHHPDRGGSAEAFLRIQSAWEATRDAGYRLDHLRSLTCACRLRPSSPTAGASRSGTEAPGATAGTKPTAEASPTTPTPSPPAAPRREPPVPSRPAPTSKPTRKRSARHRRATTSRTASPGRLDLRPRDLVFLVVTAVLNAYLELVVFCAACVGLAALVALMLVSGRRATRTARALKIVAFAVMSITAFPLVFAIAIVLVLFAVVLLVIFALW